MRITEETKQLSFEDITISKQNRYNQILENLKEPKTAKELAIDLYNKNLIISSERNHTAPRLTELEKLGKVKAIGKKKCQYTGKMVAIYERTEDTGELNGNN